MAVPLPADRVEHLLLGGGFHRLEIAAVNAPRQSVVSGPDDELERFARMTAALGAPVSRLPSPYIFHNRLCEPAARAFAESIASVATQPLMARVFSSVENGFYPDSETARAALPGHLTRPVRYLDAVRHLNAHGADTFVECGTGNILTALACRAVADVSTVAMFGESPFASQLEKIRTAAPARTSESAASGTARTVNPAPSVQPPAKQKDISSSPETDLDRDRLIAELCSAYADHLGYPEEVFTSDADLEADLGVDSLKRTELLRWTADKYRLGTLPEGTRTGDYPTVAAIAELILRPGEAQNV
ncbi:phosphopantetheine-binding protein [Amycolatopsis sp. NPDC059090]|uniref:phosphopantetheine-binding protein n=1 Tax=unclassified Amycolatopsis TaxID=2618356 RepID=UPI0036701EC1